MAEIGPYTAGLSCSGVWPGIRVTLRQHHMTMCSFLITYGWQKYSVALAGNCRAAVLGSLQRLAID